MPLAPVSATLLAQAQVAYRLHEHAEAHTTQQFMALGFPVQQMVKTLAFQAGDGGIVLVALCAADAVDYGAVARAVGTSRAKLTPLGEELLRERLGMQAGGVGPFVQQDGVRVLVDRQVPALPAVFCGSGERSSTLEVAGQAFSAIAGAVLGEFAKPADAAVKGP
jgi:prolyl-tRNA editing enzyme YbaK/EbsC (Cys-tRNA(Pro) deacylase)